MECDPGPRVDVPVGPLAARDHERPAGRPRTGWVRGHARRARSFWHGAVGVAACWAGGAQGLAERYLSRHRRDDCHALAHLGAVHAECWAMAAVLRQAADEIDGDPSDQAGEAMRRALSARHVVERACLDVMARLDRVGGPRASALDGAIVQHRADLALYLQQCHGERDLEALGRALPPAAS